MVKRLRAHARLCAGALVLLLQSGSIESPNLGRGYLSGLWSDACPCKIPCPCWRTNHSSAPECINVHVFRITHDEASGLNLSGSEFVLIAAPKSLYAAPTPVRLFIDPSVSDSKLAGIKSLITRYFGPIEIVRLPIRFSESDHSQSVEIPGMLTYTVRSLGEPPAPTVKDYLYPWLVNPMQGVVREVDYNAPGHKAIHYSGTNSLLAEFRMLWPGI